MTREMKSWNASDRCVRPHGEIRRRTKANVQEVIDLRGRGWEGLPPPPVFSSSQQKPTSASQKDTTATPVVASIRLPNGDLEPQNPHSPSPEPPAVLDINSIPASPVTHSPSISVATFSDSTIADSSDDESSANSVVSDTSGDQVPADSTVAAPYETFYLEDGNVEVLCRNALFRVHTSILYFRSPALRPMFAQTNLASAESPNGCPRILSSDTAADFSTLLKVVYLLG